MLNRLLAGQAEDQLDGLVLRNFPAIQEAIEPLGALQSLILYIPPHEESARRILVRECAHLAGI